MSFDLCNQSLALCRKYSRPFWAKALKLARLYGWQPMGTRLMPGYDFPETGDFVLARLLFRCLPNKNAS
jgi:hypothetical protein